MERDYMSVNLKTLKLGALWDNFENSRFLHLKLRLYYLYILSAVATMVIHTATLLIEIFLHLDDMEVLGVNGRIAFTFLPAVFKQLRFLQCREKVRDLMDVLRSGGFAANLRWTTEHEDIVGRANLRSRIISWCYYTYGMFMVGHMLVAVVMTTYEGVFGTTHPNETVPKKLLTGAWYPFDVQKTNYYILAFSFQAYAFTVGPTLNMAIDTLIVSLLVHSCGQFRLLKHSLRTIKDRVQQVILSHKSHLRNGLKETALQLFSVQVDDTTQEIPTDILRNIDLLNGPGAAVAFNSLKECIEHHQILLNFLDEVQNIFGPIFLCQFFFSNCTIVLTIFSVSLAVKEGDMPRSVEYLEFFLLLTIQILLYCWYGNELTNESDSLTEAMYDTPWYEAPVKFRRCLLTMMHRTTHLCILKAGFLNRISLPTFISIMKASFSYFTVLNERSNV